MEILASSVDDAAATLAAVGGSRPAEAPQALLLHTPRSLSGSWRRWKTLSTQARLRVHQACVWNKLKPKSERHDPSQEGRGKEVDLPCLVENEWPTWQLLCQFWSRNMKIMDGIYLRAKFGCAQFQHIQAIISQHQDLCSQLQCLEAEIWAWCKSLFNKKLSTKCVDPLVAFIARRAK